MDNAQAGDLFFKIASIVSPFIAAPIAAVMAYYFVVKGKQLDILYTNKIPALKEISSQLIELNKYVGGVLAYLQANEYAGVYHPPGGALQRRSELAQAATMNALFLLPRNYILLDDLINKLGTVCAAEARFVLDPSEDLQPLYELILNKVNECMDALHKELYSPRHSRLQFNKN